MRHEYNDFGLTLSSITPSDAILRLILRRWYVGGREDSDCDNNDCDDDCPSDDGGRVDCDVHVGGEDDGDDYGHVVVDGGSHGDYHVGGGCSGDDNYVIGGC